VPLHDSRDKRRHDSHSTRARIEGLERRQLLSSIVQTLPFTLEFDKARGGIVDSAGRGTGFTVVQGNSNGDEYQPAQLLLKTGVGVLQVRSVGNAQNGGPYDNDNSLVNGLQTRFDASQNPFTVTVRIRRPADSIKQPYEQAGILFGPDQDNYLKLVAAATNNGYRVQFMDEQKTGADYIHAMGRSGVFTDIGSWDAIETLDLILAGDPSSGKFTAFYAINGGSSKKAGGELTLTGSQKASFFRSTARAGIMVMHKNGDGGISVAIDRFAIASTAPIGVSPSVSGTRPGNGATNIARDGFIAADVNLPNVGKGIDALTLNAASVRLYRSSDGVQVPSVLNTSAGGDAIILQPSTLLAANTEYTFEVTPGLQDTGGAPFVPFKSTFTTGTQVSVSTDFAFEKVELGSAQFRGFTSVRIGPDGKLYASTSSGQILRWRIRSDGTVADREIINTVRNRNGGNRYIGGLDFDPRSTSTNVIVWITHGQSAGENAANWSGAVSKLWGSKLERYADIVTGLPRSSRDHMSNQPSFGPDGGLYFAQSSMTGMGGSDGVWNNRSEHLLSAAVLRLDIARAEQVVNATGLPLNVRTDTGGSYNPFSKTAPLRIWASGVRSANELLFHSSGRLYAATTGGPAGGATPATPASNPYANNRIDGTPYTGPSVPGIARVSVTQPDLLLNIQPGGYYGHPNPVRSEFVLNGGNPTSGVDALEVAQYAAGTQPDRNWRQPIYNFGFSYMPSGLAEYGFAGTFNGGLLGKIIVTRYGGGDDLVILTPGANGSISSVQTSIPGMTGLVDPLDVAVDPLRGNIYVSEFGARRITLLRPVKPGPEAQADKTRLLFVDPRGGAASPVKTVSISNKGTSSVVIPPGGINLTGDDASMFSLLDTPTLPAVVQPGDTLEINLQFNPGATVGLSIKTAELRIATNDEDNPLLRVWLRGLPTTGTGGMNEPSLQRVFDLYELPINVGDSNPDDTLLDSPPKTPNDEIDVQRWVKAGSGPVTVQPIAAFAVNQNPSVRVGFYSPGTVTEKDELFLVSGADAQSVDPVPQGSSQFDPGDRPFALFATFPGFSNTDGTNREVYSEDSLNLWETIAANRNKVRVYPLRGSDGTPISDGYVLAFEEFTRDYDNQDVVLVLRNVRPAPAGPEIGLSNVAYGPWADRLVMSKLKNNTARDGSKLDSYDIGKLQIRNTGTSDLVVSALEVSGPFKLNTPTTPFTIAPGSSRQVQVQFTQNTGVSKSYTGSLVIRSNDADEPVVNVELVGYYQTDPEQAPSGADTEPSLITIAELFGISTKIVNPGQSLDTGGRIAAVGEEILSPYFVAADPGQRVVVHQIATYHQPTYTSTIRWFQKGSNTLNTLFSAAAVDAQTLSPRKQGQLSQFAVGGFKTTATFGFKVDTEWSDPARNTQEKPGGNYGHHFRIYPVRDRNGQLVDNTLLVAMDYQGVNYDYNDNVYIVSNIRPEKRPPMPEGLTAIGTSAGIRLRWADLQTEGIAGYNLYRSGTANGTYTRLNSGLLLVSDYLDGTAVSGGTYFYRLTSVDTGGVESVAHSVIGYA
jgi:glucose/arabinose dehydrogenase